MITIIDYGAGNIKSVANMLRAIGVKSQISADPSMIAEAERLILPGVGHFDFGMNALADRGLIDALNKRVQDQGIPLLGICLGAQLLTRRSDEGERPGLGWIAAETVAFDRKKMDDRLRLPHMGWSDVWATQANPLLDQDKQDARFYHVHKYHLRCDHTESAILSSYYGYDYVTGIQAENVLGVQFHPEKSHRFGMDVLKRFAAWSPDGVNT
jgi:glutamine amidotransferase